MQKLLILLLLTNQVFAHTFYVSETGNDHNTALNPRNAWKTITRLNKSWAAGEIKGGDSVLFEAGFSYYGKIIAGSSGTTENPIVLSAYGKGAPPIITGFITLTSWKITTAGIYSSNINEADSALIVVTINGRLQRLGRTPNADAANGGWLTYESTNAAIPALIDQQLKGTIDYSGAEIAVRKQHWVIDRCMVLAQSGQTISYQNPTGNPTTYYGKDGYGYFFQNDLRTLDQFGEWFLNKSTKELSIFFGGTKPNSYIIKAATLDTLLNCGGAGRPSRNNIIVSNLGFEGANKVCLFAQDGADITVRNCTFSNSFNGIYMWNVGNSLLESNKIRDCLNNGIGQHGRESGQVKAQNNSISRCGLFAGMGASGDGSYCGYRQDGNNTIISYNRIDSVGYNGLEFTGSNVSIENNYVSNFCMTKDDGGGIYTWSNNGKKTYSNRVIKNNIVIGGIGAPLGTPGTTKDANSIYMDAGANNVQILNNTLSQTANAAIFVNNGVNLDIKNNLIYNTPVGLSMQRFYGNPLLRGVTVKNNVFYVTKHNIFYWNSSLNVPEEVSIQEDIRAIGTFDSNYYRNNLSAPFDYFYHLKKKGSKNDSTFTDPPSMDFKTWQNFIGQEPTSAVLSTAAVRFEFNAAASTESLSIPGLNYRSVTGAVYRNTVSIPAYASAIFFADGTIIVQPPGSTDKHPLVK